MQLLMSIVLRFAFIFLGVFGADVPKGHLVPPALDEEETQDEVDVMGSEGGEEDVQEEVDDEEDVPPKFSEGPCAQVVASSFLATSYPGGERHRRFFKSSLIGVGSSKKSKVSGASSPSAVHLDEDDQVECVPPRSLNGAKASTGSTKGKGKVSVERGGDQVRHTSDASLFDGISFHNASRF